MYCSTLIYAQIELQQSWRIAMICEYGDQCHICEWWNFYLVNVWLVNHTAGTKNISLDLPMAKDETLTIKKESFKF